MSQFPKLTFSFPANYLYWVDILYALLFLLMSFLQVAIKDSKKKKNCIEVFKNVEYTHLCAVAIEGIGRKEVKNLEPLFNGIWVLDCCFPFSSLYLYLYSFLSPPYLFYWDMISCSPCSLQIYYVTGIALNCSSCLLLRAKVVGVYLHPWPHSSC